MGGTGNTAGKLEQSNYPIGVICCCRTESTASAWHACSASIAEKSAEIATSKRRRGISSWPRPHNWSGWQTIHHLVRLSFDDPVRVFRHVEQSGLEHVLREWQGLFPGRHSFPLSCAFPPLHLSTPSLSFFERRSDYRANVTNTFGGRNPSASLPPTATTWVVLDKMTYSLICNGRPLCAPSAATS